jgi:short-subunit dehydrogenase
MNHWQGKWALITGASAGIGTAIARELAAGGTNLVLTARRRDRLTGLSAELSAKHNIRTLACVADLAQPLGPQEIFSFTEGKNIAIDLLVNNAGFGVAPAGAEESSIQQAQAIFDTNFMGVVRMTRAVVPHMRQQSSGRIINIGSVLGFLPMPYMALYSATKHAVAGYSEALDHELRAMGIRVSVVEPAYINTPFDANLMKPDAPLDVYREIRAAVERRVKAVLVGAEGPEIVAEMVLNAAMADRPKTRYAPGRASRLRLLRRFAPAGVLDAGVRKDLGLEV